MLTFNTDLHGKTVLVTGAAGFIGYHFIKKILDASLNCYVVGLDNLNDYYDVSLKEFRLKELMKNSCFHFERIDISNKDCVLKVFQTYHPDLVVNLAAQAGVRYSVDHPDAYIQSNLVGFFNILEACRHSYRNSQQGVIHLVYASSSSVYGATSKVPYSIEEKTDRPVSLYAATKKADELLAYAYSELYHIPMTGLRFFTVYGPSGRPDMAYFKFAEKLRRGETIQIYNFGQCWRDFTYIDDIVEGIYRVLQYAPTQKDNENSVPYALYNIGKGNPDNLLDFIEILQQELVAAGGLPADYDFEGHRELVPAQPGDVPITYADISGLMEDFGFRPTVGLRDGLRNFVEWYVDCYAGHLK